MQSPRMVAWILAPAPVNVLVAVGVGEAIMVPWVMLTLEGGDGTAEMEVAVLFCRNTWGAS